MRRLLLLTILGGFTLLTAAVLIIATAFRPAPVDRGDAIQHSHKGLAFMRQHLYHAAIQEFETATRQSPQALDPWVGLAAVYIRLGNGPKALEGAGKAVTIAENSADAQLILGRAHWMVRNFDDAERAAHKVEDLDPSNRHAAELLLRVYFDRKDDAKFREVLDRISDPSRAVQDLAVQFAIRRGEFRRAWDLRNSFDRRELEREVLRTELALKREPTRSAELYPLLIQNLIRLGRPEAAIAARREYGGSKPLDLEMGKAYWLAGKSNEAEHAFALASAGRTHKLSAEVALAALTGDRKHWAAAFRAEWPEKDYFVLAQLESVLAMATPLEKARIYRYAGLFDADLFNDAAREALAALDAEPDSFDALMTLGTAYSRLGRIDDAIRYIRQGADRHPESADAWSRLGQYELAKGNLANAEQALEKAVRMDPANASVLYNYAWFLDQNDRDTEAIPYYQRAIAASPLSFEAMNNLALIEDGRGRSGRALTLLNQAVDANPDNEMALLNRGNYYATQRLWRSALAEYARAMRLNPFNTFAIIESARTHMELNRDDIAIDELSAALDIDPGASEAYVLLSAAYKKQGRDTEAAAALEESKRAGKTP
jgi:tetratricopeptide (TPR) repeat protein